MASWQRGARAACQFSAAAFSPTCGVFLNIVGVGGWHLSCQAFFCTAGEFPCGTWTTSPFSQRRVSADWHALSHPSRLPLLGKRVIAYLQDRAAGSATPQTLPLLPEATASSAGVRPGALALEAKRMQRLKRRLRSEGLGSYCGARCF